MRILVLFASIVPAHNIACSAISCIQVVCTRPLTQVEGSSIFLLKDSHVVRRILASPQIARRGANRMGETEARPHHRSARSPNEDRATLLPLQPLALAPLAHHSANKTWKLNLDNR